MAKIFIYDKDKNIVETMDSEQYSLDGFLDALKYHSEKQRGLDLRIEECFDSTNTYYNIHFVPNSFRITKVE